MVNIRQGYVSSNRDELAKEMEIQFCITRKLFCPAAYELADTLIYLDKHDSATPGEIVKEAKVRQAEVNSVLSVLKRAGYISVTKGRYSRIRK